MIATRRLTLIATTVALARAELQDRAAFADLGVIAIAVETEWANPASVRVLERSGFLPAGATSDPAGMRFELRATPS